MKDRDDVVVYSELAKVVPLDKLEFRWRESWDKNRTLFFDRAYQIRGNTFAAPLFHCRYRVGDREFTDLSFLKGKTLEEYPDHCEIREHADGTRFVFSYVDIPTFDSDDREWDGAGHTAVYCDGEEIILIYCRHGYSIPRISVYMGLKHSFDDFTPWLERLGCADKLSK